MKSLRVSLASEIPEKSFVHSFKSRITSCLYEIGSRITHRFDRCGNLISGGSYSSRITFCQIVSRGRV
jgi:hypothetical protein